MVWLDLGIPRPPPEEGTLAVCPGFFHLETEPGLYPRWNVSGLLHGALWHQTTS